MHACAVSACAIVYYIFRNKTVCFAIIRYIIMAEKPRKWKDERNRNEFRQLLRPSTHSLQRTNILGTQQIEPVIDSLSIWRNESETFSDAISRPTSNNRVDYKLVPHTHTSRPNTYQARSHASGKICIECVRKNCYAVASPKATKTDSSTMEMPHIKSARGSIREKSSVGLFDESFWIKRIIHTFERLARIGWRSLFEFTLCTKLRMPFDRICFPFHNRK